MGIDRTIPFRAALLSSSAFSHPFANLSPGNRSILGDIPLNFEFLDNSSKFNLFSLRPPPLNDLGLLSSKLTMDGKLLTAASHILMLEMISVAITTVQIRPTDLFADEFPMLAVLLYRSVRGVSVIHRMGKKLVCYSIRFSSSAGSQDPCRAQG